MRRTFFAVAVCLSGFLGGSVAQTIGGGIFIAHAATAWLSLIGSLSGSPPTNPCLAGTCADINFLDVTGDTQAAGQGGPGGPTISALTATHVFGGGVATGNFIGAQVNLNQTATTGNTQGNYVGELINAAISASVSENSSSLWAANGLSTCSATSWLQCIGVEWDVAAKTGSAVSDKIGEQIVQTSIDAVTGSRSNIGITMNNAAGATGWDCGLCFGNFAGNWPLTSTGTLIGGWAHGAARASNGVPTNNAGTVLYGVDLSNVTFAAGGAPYLAPLITPASSATTCRQGSVEWDASFIYICTAANTWKRAALSSF